MEPGRFREALARHPAGVVVITSALGGHRAALTVTSFTSASASPPLVSFYLKKESSARSVLLHAEWFAANFPASSQQEVAASCATSGIDRFSPAHSWEDGSFGLPLLKGAAVQIVCRRERVMEVGDHFLVVGTVAEVVMGESRYPLLYYDHAYAGVCRPNHPGQ
ncbi:flavin reductase family protein [Streptomyces sp. NPDC047985]|uniref:flavin reductase family protein n=1 Tax=unclassified Streptomyces TaxID=2593676 RepID=UPI00343F529C